MLNTARNAALRQQQGQHAPGHVLLLARCFRALAASPPACQQGHEPLQPPQHRRRHQQRTLEGQQPQQQRQHRQQLLNQQQGDGSRQRHRHSHGARSAAMPDGPPASTRSQWIQRQNDRQRRPQQQQQPNQHFRIQQQQPGQQQRAPPSRRTDSNPVAAGLFSGSGSNENSAQQQQQQTHRRPQHQNQPGPSGAARAAARASAAAAMSALDRAEPKQRIARQKKKKRTEVFLPSYVTVSNLARVLGIKLWDLQVRMRNMGHSDLRPDLTLPFADAELIAAEFDLLAIANDEAAFDIYPRPPLSALQAALSASSSSSAATPLPIRPPVVTIMGHVDHGKTTLLDKLRSTSVAAGEAGGITQHIGAFSVPVVTSSSSPSNDDGPQFVTFLDTPGHAAFTAMRSRGASVTDIVVLVVAADDGVMPQTREVIELWKELSAREAQFDPSSASSSSGSAGSTGDAGPSSLPSSPSSSSSSQQAAALATSAPGGRRLGSGAVQLVVALTKSDKPTADPERVKRQLLVEGIELEEYGGEIPCVSVSGKTGEGLDLLQDTLVTLAELAELRAEREGPVEGYVIESRVEKGRGNVATVLVKRGALRVGDVGVAGTTWAKVRSLTDSAGKSLRALKPGQAGLVTGWKELPSAGDEILGAPTAGSASSDVGENAAKRAVENRKRRLEARKLGEEVAQINEQRRIVAAEAERKKRAEFVERQQRRLAEAALAAGKSVEELMRETKSAAGSSSSLSTAAAAVLEEGSAKAEGSEDADSEDSKKKELLVIVKADVSGSVEAVIGAISGIGNKDAGVRIVSSGVGEPTEGDLAMAKAVGARIIGFNVGIPRAIERSAASHSPPIPLHSSPIIYRLMEYVSASVGELLPPIRQIRVTGEALVAQVFKINLRSRVFVKIAGCRVTNGTIARSSEVRILRASSSSSGQADYDDDDDDEKENSKGDGGGGDESGSVGLKVGDRVGGGRTVVWLGKLDSLKHGKTEVAERGKGTECGMSFDGFQAFEEGDVVQCYYTVDVPRQLM